MYHQNMCILLYVIFGVMVCQRSIVNWSSVSIGYVVGNSYRCILSICAFCYM